MFDNNWMAVVEYALWVPLKKFVDFICKYAWKLFNIPQGAVALIFGCLTFYFGVLDISHTILEHTTSLTTKIFSITIQIIVVMTLVGVIYMHTVFRSRRLISGQNNSSWTDSFSKAVLGFVFINSTARLGLSPLLGHGWVAPTIGWYYAISVGCLMSNDNNDGETIPSKLLNKLNARKLATVQP